MQVRRLFCYLGFHDALSRVDPDAGYIWTLCYHCDLERRTPLTVTAARRFGLDWPPPDSPRTSRKTPARRKG